MSNTLNIPSSKPIDPSTGFFAREWLLWIMNPNLQSISADAPIDPESGGSGSSTIPGDDQIMVGMGGVYQPVNTLPVSAFPGLLGDVTAASGSLVTTLATVNTTPGTYGSGTSVAVVTVNGKGLSTVVAATPITGAPGNFVAVGNVAGVNGTFSGPVTGSTVQSAGAFGCNGQSVQTAAAAGAAVIATAATNVTPFGYATAAQADRIVTLLNTIRAALIANGIMV